MSQRELTAFGLAGGHPAFRHTIDRQLTSQPGLECCRELIARLGGGEKTADVPFPLIPDSSQRLTWGVPFLDELDDVCRSAYETVMKGWPGHVFSVQEVRQAPNRHMAQGVVMPYDSTDDFLKMLEMGQTGELLAIGVVIPDDESAEAHDAFGELMQIMLTAALAERLRGTPSARPPSLEPFTAQDIVAAKPALLLQVYQVDSAEFAGRLVSFAGHYAFALLDQ